MVIANKTLIFCHRYSSNQTWKSLSSCMIAQKIPPAATAPRKGSYYFSHNDCIYLITTLFQPSEGIREMYVLPVLTSISSPVFAS